MQLAQKNTGEREHRARRRWPTLQKMPLGAGLLVRAQPHTHTPECSIGSVSCLRVAMCARVQCAALPRRSPHGDAHRRNKRKDGQTLGAHLAAAQCPHEPHASLLLVASPCLLATSPLPLWPFLACLMARRLVIVPVPRDGETACHTASWLAVCVTQVWAGQRRNSPIV